MKRDIYWYMYMTDKQHSKLYVDILFQLHIQMLQVFFKQVTNIKDHKNLMS